MKFPTRKVLSLHQGTPSGQNHVHTTIYTRKQIIIDHDNDKECIFL